MTVFQYSDELLAVAEKWAVYASTLTDTDGNTWPVTRCGECRNAILHQPDEPAGVAFHMIQVHGYRMDGRNERDQETAARAAAERGEMNAYRS
jgi:hypothetical protein